MIPATMLSKKYFIPISVGKGEDTVDLRLCATFTYLCATQDTGLNLISHHSGVLGAFVLVCGISTLAVHTLPRLPVPRNKQQTDKTLYTADCVRATLRFRHPSS